jgi:hypothetical protein
MFLHHTDSFYIAYLNTTVHFNGLNGTAYTRPSRVRNNDDLPQGGDHTEARGCGVWILAAFWGTLFHLAASPFNWNDKVMEEVGEKVGRMLNKEAIRGRNAGETKEESTTEGLKRKYPWWMSSSHALELIKLSEKTADTMLLSRARTPGCEGASCPSARECARHKNLAC